MNSFYEAWLADGEPFRMARPIAEVVAKLKAARPAAAKLGLFGSIGDTAHLTATTPLDHTPYSQSGWPLPSPYGVLFATDIMHRPDLGLDCNTIFKHWLAEAKAGHLPWLKYLIWQAKRYDVRNNWAPVDASGHYDHVHASGRTDHVNTGIGDFDPLGDDMNLTDKLSNGYSVNNALVTLLARTTVLANVGDLKVALDKILAESIADGASSVTMTDADRADLVARFAAAIHVPTAEENAAAGVAALAADLAD